MYHTHDGERRPSQAAESGAPPRQAASLENNRFVQYAMVLLDGAGSPAALVDGSGMVHWGNGSFWTQPEFGPDESPAALIAALSDQDRRDLLAQVRQLGNDTTRATTTVAVPSLDLEMRLTVVPSDSAPVFACQLTSNSTHPDVERAERLEAALRRVRTEIGALLLGDGGAEHTNGEASTSLPLPEHLSDRRREVARLVLSGHAISTIATMLELSPNTVRNHVKAVLRLTETHSRAELVRRYHL